MVTLGIGLLLVACGGGDRAPDPPLATDTLVGTVSFTGPVNQLSVNVMASNLLVLNRRSDALGHFESQPLSRSPAPYLLQTNDGPSWTSVALHPGRANINPLTTLLMAQLLGERPDQYYYAVAPGRVIDFPALTQADIDAAQAKVVQRLKRQFGIDVPAMVESFITTPYQATAGDPMHELLLALDAALGTAGTNLEALVAEVAAESLRCRRERLVVADGSASTELCPTERSTEPDAQDASVTVYGFTGASGDRLSVRVRGDEVLSIELLRADGSLAACEAEACAGVTLQAADGQDPRSIGFEAVALVGDAGPLRIDGSLRSGQGATPPDCAGPGWQVRFADASTERDCVGSRSAAVDYGRDIFGFTGRLDATRKLEVRLDGARVAWIALAREGADGVDYRCRYEGCAGVTVGEPDAQGRRRITLNGLILQRANNDGTVVDDDTAVVDAEITTSSPAARPGFCPVVSTVSASSTLSSAMAMCIDGRAQLNDFRLDDAGQPAWFFIELADGVTGTPLWLEVDMRGTNTSVVRLFKDNTYAKVLYRCDGAACAGLGGSFANLRLTAQLQGLVLREVEPDNGAGERTLTLTGWARTTSDLIF